EAAAQLEATAKLEAATELEAAAKLEATAELEATELEAATLAELPQRAEHGAGLLHRLLVDRLRDRHHQVGDRVNTQGLLLGLGLLGGDLDHVTADEVGRAGGDVDLGQDDLEQAAQRQRAAVDLAHHLVTDVLGLAERLAEGLLVDAETRPHLVFRLQQVQHVPQR